MVWELKLVWCLQVTTWASVISNTGNASASPKPEGRVCLWTLCWGMQGPGGFFHVASHFWDNFLLFNSCSWLNKSWCSSSNSICHFRAEILSCNIFSSQSWQKLHLKCRTLFLTLQDTYPHATLCSSSMSDTGLIPLQNIVLPSHIAILKIMVHRHSILRTQKAHPFYLLTASAKVIEKC